MHAIAVVLNRIGILPIVILLELAALPRNLACCPLRLLYFIRAFTGSLTFSTLSISMLRKPCGVFSTFWI